MGRKYTNPDASGYLLEAKACEKVTKELRRIAEKFQRAVDKESADRQTEFETAMQYMKRFVKCFFELLTQNFSARRETDRKNGCKTRLWTIRSPFRG